MGKGFVRFSLLICLFSISPNQLGFAETLQSKQQKQDQNFQEFVLGIRKEALKRHISQQVLDKYLVNLKAPRVAPLLNLTHQPQKKLSFKQYFHDFVPQTSIKKGQHFFLQYHDVLTQVAKQFKVQPQYLVALWGFETDFGKYTGHSPLVASLVTLAYQKHRSQYYRDELFAALKMLEHQRLPEQAISAWDGGMGQPSFEPTTYFVYAVDFDRDGFKNIWTSMPDTFASIANFLHSYKWQDQQPWGVEVILPANFNMSLKNKRMEVQAWQKLQVQSKENLNLYKNIKAKLISVDTKDPRTFLVFPNFKVLLHWNNTIFEGLSVGLFADKIREKNVTVQVDN